MRIEISKSRLQRFLDGEEDITLRIVGDEPTLPPAEEVPSDVGSDWKRFAMESRSPDRVHHVSADGDPFSEGSSRNFPTTFESAKTRVEPGDQIRFETGTYEVRERRGASFQLTRSGVSGEWITVAPHDDAVVKLRGYTNESVLDLAGDFLQSWGFDVKQEYTVVGGESHVGPGVALSGYRRDGVHGSHHHVALGMLVEDCAGGAVNSHWSSGDFVYGNTVRRSGFYANTATSNLSAWWPVWHDLPLNEIDDLLAEYGISDVWAGNISEESDNLVPNANDERGRKTDGNNMIYDLADYPNGQRRIFPGEALIALNEFRRAGGMGCQVLDSSGVAVLHNLFDSNGLRGDTHPGLSVAGWNEVGPAPTMVGGNLYLNGDTAKAFGKGQLELIQTGLDAGTGHSLEAVAAVVARELT